MRPLRLELGGFARFRERQVISFDDLELFAISGPTGAGKTLILDALSYALYGVTPRLSQKLDGLISNGSDRLLVDLQFEASGGTFRVTRTMERKPNSVAKSTRIERLEQGRWLREAETEKLSEADRRLREIVGFDFAAFTRSILLPQGQFDEFLHGEARQRRALLKELLDLQRVDRMREEAGKRERAEGARAEALSQRLADPALHGAETEVRALRDSVQEVAAQQLTVQERLTAGRADLVQAEAAAQRFTELRTVMAQLQQLREVGDEPLLRAELAQARSAAELLPLLEEVEAEEKAAAAEQAELDRLAATLETVSGQLEAAQQAAAAAASARADREAGLRNRIERLQQLVPLAARLSRLGGPPACPAVTAAEWDEARLEQLLELRSGLTAVEAAEDRARRAEQRHETAVQEAVRAEAALVDTRGRLEDVLQQGRQARDRVADLQKQLAGWGGEHLNAVLSLRAALEPGADCPVCGRALHEHLPPAPAGAAELQVGLKRAEQEREGLLERYRDLQTAEAGLAAKLEADRSRVAEVEAELEAARTAAADLLARFLEHGLHGDSAGIRAQLDDELDAQRAALAGLLQQAGAGTDPAGAAAALQAELDALAAAERETGAAFARVEREQLQIAGQLEVRRAAAGNRATRLETMLRQLEAGIATAGLADRAELRRAHRSADRMSELEELLARRQAELDRLTARQAQLHAETAGLQDPGDGLAELRAQVSALEQQTQQLAERRGELQARLKIAEERNRERLRLLGERREVEEGQEVWKLLAVDLMDNRFTDFLLADLQKRLAQQASRIIRQVTDDRFDLRLSAAREFEVSDAWAGGELRPVRSLSGGETFIVSLALALALSETAAGGRRLGALFLDEGFGTLDAQTLDSVATVLENLSTDGRMVGLITHVPELSARMPARLMVRKEADGSSVWWED